MTDKCPWCKAERYGLSVEPMRSDKQYKCNSYPWHQSETCTIIGLRKEIERLKGDLDKLSHLG